MINPYNIEWAKAESISFEIWHKMRMSSLTTPINIILEVLARIIRQVKEIKHVQIESQILSVCQTHDPISREPHHLSTKAP